MLSHTGLNLHTPNPQQNNNPQPNSPLITVDNDNMGQYFSTETAANPSPEALSASPPTDEEFRPPSIEDTPMGEVNSYFRGLKQSEILEYCLGYDESDAPALTRHVVLIALTCGTVEEERFPMLDIGLHAMKREDIRLNFRNPGPHSARILQNISYYHMRLSHNAGHANRLPNPMDADINRFGSTRFVTLKEMSEVLEACLTRPIDPGNQKMEYCSLLDKYVPEPDRFCPVVLLNFDKPQCDLIHDTFGLRPWVWQNVVATISTQGIAQEQGFNWRDDLLTLPQLTKDLGIEYPTLTSAADHAAFTLIDAVQMVMRPKIPTANESIRSVVNTTMLHSQCKVPSWGKENFCTKCGGDNHKRLKCRTAPELACDNCMHGGRRDVMFTHHVIVCPWWGR
jgi:hypothetical protein